MLRQHEKGDLYDNAMCAILKDNIKMRTKGLGFDKNIDPDFTIPWSCQGDKTTITELANHLKWIISEEKKYEIPSEPKVNMPQKPNMAMLGTPAVNVDKWDAKYKAEEDVVRKNADEARRESEARGEKSLYSMMQPWFPPPLEDLVDRRIDVLCNFTVKNDNVLRWCQGKVLKIINKEKNKVSVKWDAMPDVEAEAEDGTCILPPGKWNKDRNGAWRLDVDVEICANDGEVSQFGVTNKAGGGPTGGEQSDDESKVSDSEEEESDSESESKREEDE